MSKKLDNLFEQARNSIKSEMPLEEVQELIYGQASPSFWTNQKIWIMSTSIIGIIIISAICLWNNNELPETVAIKETPPSTYFQPTNNNPKTTIPIHQKPLEAIPDNIPLPILSNHPITPIQAKSLFVNNTLVTEKILPSRLDSLGPKKTFTEYKLEIKKENSEQEIKKLKSELANYGIHMEIKELSYNNENKIKRFKGKFKTDSLFCGSTMNDYQFDISGSFKSMEFIFRVADNKNLKYLKIQSDNFEETIECYDDEVISSTKEAQKINREMHEVMMQAQREMAHAQEEMAKAQQEMALAREQMARAKHKELFKSLDKDQIKHYEELINIDWEQIELDIEDALDNVDINFEGIDEEVLESLEDAEVIILDNKNFRKDMDRLKRDLAKMRIDIERQVENQVRSSRNRNNELIIQLERQAEDRARLNEQRSKELRKEVERQAKTRSKISRERNILLEKHRTKHTHRTDANPEQLKEEAAALEKAAKELRKEAKKKAKAAKKKAKASKNK